MFRKQLGKKIALISDQALECMLSYPWPGNVRELRHVIERACVLCQEGALQVKHLPAELQKPSSKEILSPSLFPTPIPQNFSSEAVPPTFQYQSEEGKIRNALRHANNNRAKAAKLLGVARSTLYRQMQRYNVTEE
jgi:transcriptional regulator of acetoin/glycerol metabolism